MSRVFFSTCLLMAFRLISSHSYEQVSLSPEHGFYTEANKYIRVWMNNASLDDCATCYLKYNNSRVLITSGIFEPYGVCGVQMRVTKDQEGEWEICQELGNLTKTARFTVVIKRKNTHEGLPNMRMPASMLGEEKDFQAALDSEYSNTIEGPPGNVERCTISNLLITHDTYIQQRNQWNCYFGTSRIVNRDYGKWTSITVYKDKKRPRDIFQLINHFYIFESIRDDELDRGKAVFVHTHGYVTVGFKYEHRTSKPQTCRLVHATSGREWEFELVHTLSEVGVQMINKAYCQIKIFVEPKQFGEWRLEERSQFTMRQANFNIIKT